MRKRYPVIDIDGVRVNYPGGGWGLLRASNTQPVLVMRFEAADAESLSRYQKEMESVLEKAKTTV
jgi:phosphomannomutase/phosphoglucomutase